MTEPQDAGINPKKPAATSRNARREQRDQKLKMKIHLKRPIRWNVIVLIAFGYATVLTMFVIVAIAEGAPSAIGVDLIQASLMALIGGTLAIAKDLVGIDQTERQKGPETEGKDGDE